MTQALLNFDGKTFSRELDGARLGAQLARVQRLMSDGAWRSLREISEATGDPEASVSARIRDLRKPRFGGWTVEHRRRGEGTWEYRVLAKHAERTWNLSEPLPKNEQKM